LVARIALSRFESLGGHLGEPYSKHPWLLLLDLSAPFVYFFAALAAVVAAQRVGRGPRVSSLVVALSTWALTCSFLVSLRSERMNQTLRWGYNQRVWSMRTEEAYAYADRAQVYLLGGFAAYAAIGAALGVGLASTQSRSHHA
jgi:hypothetical protein